MRIDWRVVAVVAITFSTVASALAADEVDRREPDIDMFASMAGKCSEMRAAEREFACNSVAFFHSPGGRSSFTVPLNDPDDDSHILTFSGAKAKRDQDLYELSVDRMLFKTKDRPKVDGLPLPDVVLASGICKQVGNFAAQRVSSISCAATDANGEKYQLQFESDGSPIRVQIIRVADQAAEQGRAKLLAAHVEQLKCRQMADAQGVLPRDRTPFILKCMDE
jgi:hypothetical protein